MLNCVLKAPQGASNKVCIWGLPYCLIELLANDKILQLLSRNWLHFVERFVQISSKRLNFVYFLCLECSITLENDNFCMATAAIEGAFVCE